MARIKSSRADGGTRRSPFLTAPFIKIVRDFGEDKTLQVGRGKSFRSKRKVQKRELLIPGSRNT